MRTIPSIILSDSRELIGRRSRSSCRCYCRLCDFVDAVRSFAFVLAFAFRSLVAGRSTLTRVFEPAIFGRIHLVRILEPTVFGHVSNTAAYKATRFLSIGFALPFTFVVLLLGDTVTPA